MRVEGNYAVARAAQWGLLSLSSNKGNIIDMASDNADNSDVLLIGEMKLDQGKSIYGRFGDWFGYFSEGLFIFLLLLFLLSARKSNDD